MNIDKTTSMRDAFFGVVYDLAKEDENVIVVSADMGAPSLDKFRKDFPNRFYNVGIAEDKMISIASGLASEGKKVYTYAIAPFITSRCYEFTKLNAGLMKFPIKLVGVGAGFSYDDSGPTHHTTEDISIMRAIPHLEVYSPSDSLSAIKLANRMNESTNPSYIRLDRKVLPQIHKDDETFENGFKRIKDGDKIAVVTTGNMVHTALKINKEMENVGVIELFQLNPINFEFKEELARYKRVVSLEEHLLNGGLGGIVSEIITDNDLPIKLKRIGLIKQTI